MAEEPSAAAGTGDPGTGAPATPAPAVPAAEPSPQGQQPTSWMDGLNPELKGWAQNRGYGEMKADEVLPKMAESYRGLEQKMGVPADRLLRLPEDMTGDDMGSVYDRLGRPATADAYDFKEALGDVEADPNFLTWFGQTAHKLGLSQGQASQLVNAYTQYEQELLSGLENGDAEMSQQQQLALQKEWGNAYQQNQRIAGAARSQLGVSDQEVDAIQDALGFERTMKLFYDIGTRTMEPNLVQGGQDVNDGAALTPEQAKAKIQELKADEDFRKKLENGGMHSKEYKQWQWLHAMANPEDGSAQVVRI